MESTPAQPGASILSLPIETRFMIYDHLLNFTGSLVIFAHYEMIRNVNKQTIRLLHLNRLIRAEVQEYFYKNQQFQFRSAPAINKFLDKIGSYYTSIIRKVQIGSWLAQRAEFMDEIGPLLQKLTSLDYLAIIAPAHGFVTKWSEDAELGDKAIAVLRASERLASGKLNLIWWNHQMDAEIRFVSQGHEHPTQEDMALGQFKAIGAWYFQHMYFAEVQITGSLMQAAESEGSELDGEPTADRPEPYNSLDPIVQNKTTSFQPRRADRIPIDDDDDDDEYTDSDGSQTLDSDSMLAELAEDG